jgi:hypothetical protein
MLFMGSNRLVHASSTTLPGDNLYPVKRTWEDMKVLLTFNTQAREALEVEHENERLDELNDLFAEGRSAKVDFAGTVKSQNGNLWMVTNIPVQISSQTDLGGQVVTRGSAIRVRGFTQADGTVLAERVELLAAGVPLPDVEENEAPGGEQELPESQLESGESHSNETQALEENEAPNNSSMEGVVDSVSGNALVVNGQSMNISGAEIKGTPQVGASAKVEGYYDANGVFIVTKIEFQSTGSDGGGDSSSSGSKDSGSDNHNDSSGSDDHGGNDSGGGGGSDSGGGGSGGGGDD